MDKSEIEPYYQLRAKEIVDALFEKGYFAKEIARNDMQRIEDLIAFNFKSFAETNLSIVGFTNLIKESEAENISTCNHAFIVASHSVDDTHTHFVRRCKHCGKENTRVFWS